MHTYIYIYIYIYIEALSLSLHVYMYIYIYIYSEDYLFTYRELSRTDGALGTLYDKIMIM